MKEGGTIEAGIPGSVAAPGRLLAGYVDRTVHTSGVDVGIGAEMAKYRGNLPQLASPTVILSDSGMETDLIFHEGFDLPLFASFTMLEDKEARTLFATTTDATSRWHETPKSDSSSKP